MNLFVKFLNNLKFYSKHLKCPNVRNIDLEFQQILQILYFFGWYQPQPTKLRTAYGVFNLCFIPLSYFLGAFCDAIAAHKAEKVFQTIINLAFVFNIVPLLVGITVIALNPVNLTELIKSLHQLHEFDDNEEMKAFSNKCCKLVKCYKFFLLAAIFLCFIMPSLGFEFFVLFSPAIYDRLAVGLFYYPLLVLNSIHLTEIVFALIICDMLPILCIMRIVKNKQLLAYDFLHCTDDDEQKNEANVDAAGLYDSTIRE